MPSTLESSTWRHHGNDEPHPSGDDPGKLLLRLLLAILILFHGVSKLVGGVDGSAAMLARAGLLTRAAALAVAANMLVAFLRVHTGQFFSMSKLGGAVTVALLGARRYSLGGAGGRFN